MFRNAASHTQSKNAALANAAYIIIAHPKQKQIMRPAALVVCVCALGLLAASHAQTFPKPGSAGAGYVSKKLRKPKWEPTFGMQLSTAIMPCNYSGFYNLSSLADYGWIQFDWSNRKDLWCQDKPMTTSETISTQAQLAHAALPSAKIGVYRPGIKAINLFAEVREKLDDPAYSGWFVKYNEYPSGGYNKNNTYFAGPCTYPNGHEGPPLQANASSGKCSPYYHEQTQVPQHHAKLTSEEALEDARRMWTAEV